MANLMFNVISIEVVVFFKVFASSFVCDNSWLYTALFVKFSQTMDFFNHALMSLSVNKGFLVRFTDFLVIIMLK